MHWATWSPQQLTRPHNQLVFPAHQDTLQIPDRVKDFISYSLSSTHTLAISPFTTIYSTRHILAHLLNRGDDNDSTLLDVSNDGRKWSYIKITLCPEMCMIT